MILPDWGEADAAPVEPHAGFRMLAQLHRQMFLAYTEAGFDPDQALELVIATIPILALDD